MHFVRILFVNCLANLGTLVLVTLTLFYFETSVAQKREEAIAKVEKEIGPIVPVSQKPETYRILSERFAQLAAVQAEEIQSHVVTNEIKIIQSNQINAFVVTASEVGKSRARNIIFLTTGLIEKYLGDTLPGESLISRINEVAGIMAHELGHPIEKLDSTGIENHYGKLASQAIEIRADTEAVRLLKKAGMPVDSLYKALLRLASLQKEKSSISFSHPETNVRLSSQRVVLTADRVQSGSIPSDGFTISEETNQALAKESMSKKENAPQIEMLPTSLEHLESLLRARQNSERGVVQLTNVERNAWLLWFDHTLEKMNTQISEADRQLIDKIRKYFIDEGSLHAYCPTTACLLKLFEGIQVAGLEALPLIPHREFIDRVSAYNQWLHSSSGVGLLFSSRSSSISQFNQQAGFSKFQKDLDKAFSDVSGGLYIEDTLFWLEFFHTEGFQRLSRMYQTEDLRLFSFHHLLPTSKSRVFWNQILNRTQSEKNVSRAKALLSSIWQNRGFWAYIEFVGVAEFNIDWSFVAERLGIDKNQVKPQIEKEFRKFVEQEFVAKSFKANDIRDQGYTDVVLTQKVKPDWLTSSTVGFLEGTVRKIQDTDGARKIGGAWLRNFYYFYPDQLEGKVRKAMVENLSSLSEAQKQDPRAIRQSTRKAMESSAGTNSSFVYPAIVRVSADEIIRSSSIQESVKDKTLMVLMFGLDAQEWGRWDVAADKSNVTYLYSLLVKRKFIRNFSDLCDKMDQMMKDNLEKYYSIDVKGYLVKLASVIKGEIESTMANKSLAKEEFLKYLEKTSRVLAKHFNRAEFSESTKSVELFIEAAKRFQFTASQKLFIFNHLTNLAVTAQTDDYFRNALQSEVIGHRAGKTVSRVLKDGRIRSPEYQVELASPLIRSKVDNGVEIADVIDEVSQLVPKESNNKDALVESLGWKYELSDRSLMGYIESEKLSNWRKMDARWFPLASVVGNYIHGLSTNRKLELLDYIIAAGGKGVPPVFAEEMRKDAIAKIPKGIHEYEKKVVEVENQVRQSLEKLDVFVRSSTPLQRVPLIELILSAGQSSLYSQPAIYEYLLQKYAKVQVDSLEYMIIKSYLEAIPAHEVSVTMAYMFANSGGEGAAGNLKAILEIFGPIGIKFGQMAGIWNMFGDAYKKQLADLLDKATPMTKAEIEIEIKKQLAAAGVVQNFKLLKVLGSASVKTVVLIETSDGEKLALMLKRPGIEHQIRTTLEVAKKFISALKRNSVLSKHPLFAPLIESIEEQIFEEINFRNEIAHYKKVSEMLEGMNKTSLLKNSRQWSMKIPRISSKIPESDGLFAVEAIGVDHNGQLHGVSVKEYLANKNVAQEDKVVIGELITKASVHMLFQYGYFDPDRHAGNWMIDPLTKSIFFIDPGQLKNFSASKNPWKSDPRLTLSFFFKGIEDKDVRSIVHYAAQMSVGGEVPSEIKAKATQEIEKILNQKGLIEEQQLQKIVEALYGSGMKLNHTFTFGALKGLMILSGSEYVSREKFKEIFKAEVLSLAARKAPVVLTKVIADAALKVKEMVVGVATSASVSRAHPTCQGLFK